MMNLKREKSLLSKNLKLKRNILEKLNQKLLKQGFQVKSAQNGIYMMPVYKGKQLKKKNYEKWDVPLEKRI